MSVITGTVGATGATPWVQVTGFYNVQLTGTWVGTVVIERSFDNGVTSSAISRDASGTPNSFTTNISLAVFEPENNDPITNKPNVLVRVNWTRTSGSLNYRIGQ